MNSIVQEASSIAKAVETAWAKAGKPQKFSIRVFEEAQKNFFGITSKPAKIALLFDQKDVVQQSVKTVNKTIQKKDRPEKPKDRELRPQRQQRPIKQQPQPLQKRQSQLEKRKIEARPIQKKETKKVEGKKPKELWTDEMVAIARNWMTDMLITLGKTDITFTTEVKRYYLKFMLNKPLDSSESKEKGMFRNFAHLIMQSVRNRLKKQFRYHKVVISSER